MAKGWSDGSTWPGSYIAQQALIGGRIDAYVEYTGTALTAILKQPVDRDAARVMRTISQLYQERYGVWVGPSLGFEDTFAMVVRGGGAPGVTTLSGAVGVAKGWKLGVGYEFEERPDGLRGMEAAYGLAVPGGAAGDGIWGCSTGRWPPGRWTSWRGTRRTDRSRRWGCGCWPMTGTSSRRTRPCRWCGRTRCGEHPALRRAVERLAGQVSEADVRAMNDAVDREHRDVGEVVREFRKGKGL